MSRRKFDLVDRDGVRIMADRCDTCIFRPGNLMHLESGRVKGMVDGAIAVEGSIPCHKTLDLRKQAICRGFWDGHRFKVPLLTLADRIKFWKPIQLDKDGSHGSP